MWEQEQAVLPPLWIAPGEESADGAAAYPHGEAIRAVLSRYAWVLGVPLSFHTTDSRYSPPASRDAVHVHAFALATPPSLFGVWPRVPLIPLPFAHGVPLREGAHWALAPGTHLGRGRPLSDQDGNAVGECCGTNLYSLFDLLGQEPIWVPLLLRRHLDLGLPYLLPALAPAVPTTRWEGRLQLLRDETEACARAGRAALHRVAREAYVTTCRECVAEEIRFLQIDIAFLEDGAEEIARRITADTRRLMEGRRRLRQLQEGREVQAPPDQTLEALKGLPEVREGRMLQGGGSG